ncbi:c-type cytochrome biogenesis protein CcsB [Sunxiuqinia sp. sy24]|uniref:c-type cytochrome biogenesis protein CcsB n=1 Tax=Sunxiuqinia sp. sy24 TaxID=3461495 RepID=UPI004045B6C4
MKRIYHFLVSTAFMGFLLLIMAFSMAIATFIESSYGTPAAKALVYNTHWFELVFLLLGISLIHNFIKYRQYTIKKLTIGLFHLSFILIVIGAGITRYISFEGMMHIREGSSADYIVSTDSYFTVETDQQKLSDKVLFSELSAKEFNEKLTIEGQSVRVKTVGFVKDAARTPIESQSGDPMVDFVISAGQGMESFTFGKGQQVNLGPATVGFEGQADVRFEQEGSQLYVVADRDMEIRSMAGGEPERVPAGTRSEVKLMHLYAFDGYLVLVKKFYENASLRVSKSASGDTGEDAVIVEISDGDRQAVVNVFGRAGQLGDPVTYMVGNTPVKLTYGSQPVKLPFRLKLKDFQLERYIGSESPSSFASEIQLIDDERNVQRDVRIFMNNTLKYRGFRFYQSSYDQDELGTVLSVNKDFWGTFVTYVGYFLLTLGMILSLLNKNSYFQFLVRHLKQSSKTKFAVLLLALLVIGQTGNAQSTAGIPRLDKELVSDFSELWVHGHDGRIEPMSTLSSEILRKLSRKSSLNGMSSDEVVLSMNLYPALWRSIPFIKIDKEIASSIGVREKYARITDLFDLDGNYRITEQVKAAFAKAPAFRNKLDKEYIFLDERINISFMVFKGDLLTFFPPANQTDAWWSVGSKPTGYPTNDSLFVNRSFNLLAGGIDSNGDIQPRQIMATIAAFQQKFGADILPSEQKKSAEMLYNEYQPFKRVFPWYLLTGFILLAILFVNIFRQKPIHRVTRITFSGLIFIGFLVHTLGLIIRWYISGRAPWSNGYESMIYVAWAAMLAGIIFGRKYPMVLGTAAILSGITLFVAHLNWMNPEITPLVPVLKSYWLMIHVSIITASYGFIGLSAFLGLLVLVLYALMTKNNHMNVDYFIDQLTTISELSATIGLYMLTIGTFLGGVWANESWGRYWGWDPKETWALITAVIYAFIVHMRLIPSLRGRYNYNLATVIGFTSVLMTYFGVNYFLSGLHSYGKGSADGIHWAVYISIGLITILAVWSYAKYKKYEEVGELN